jgi:hypothetical protein
LELTEKQDEPEEGSEPDLDMGEEKEEDDEDVLQDV